MSVNFADEAKALGADIRAIRKKWAPLYREPSDTAEVIRQVWDYRKAGLTIDRARELIYRWCKSTVGIHHSEQPVSGGRIANMAKYLPQLRKDYLDTYSFLIKQTNVWVGDFFVWYASGRTIVTIRHYDITWSPKKHYHWPQKEHVSYTSTLLIEGLPHARRLLKEHDCSWVDAVIRAGTEKIISHDLRGQWQKKVAEQFGLKYIVNTQPIIRYKKVGYDPNTPDVVYSLYDHSIYKIGQERHEKALRGHKGGLYCYSSISKAYNAIISICEESTCLQKRIVKVQVRGKHVTYTSGKEAWSYMTVLDFVDD